MPSLRETTLTILISSLLGLGMGGMFAQGLPQPPAWMLAPFIGSPVEQIVISQEIGDKLHTVYETSVRTGKEQARCLYGKRRGDAFHLTGLDTTRVWHAEHGKVLHDPSGCARENYLGTVHTHPIVTGRVDCTLSAQDRQNLKRNESLKLVAVLCLPGRIVWATHQDTAGEHLRQVPSSPDRQPTTPVFIPSQVRARELR